MNETLGSLLLKANILTPEELERAQDHARQRKVSLWEIVTHDLQTPEETLAEAFANLLRLPRVRLASASLDSKTVRIIKESLARRHACLPLMVEGKTLVLAMANALDYSAIQDVEFASGLRVRPVVATWTEIMDAIEQHYATAGRLQNFLANVAEPTDFQIAPQEREQADVKELDLSETEAPPVVKMCNLMINDAIKSQASDIHVEPELNFVKVRMRVDGVLREYIQVPKWLHTPVVSRLKVLANLDIAERRVPQDGRIKAHSLGHVVDLRLSTLPTHFGEKVVMRLLGSSTIPELGKLGLPGPQYTILEQALNQPQGLILVTGPTGSGKSTTLYSMLLQRRSPDVNITTVEDPIEYQVPGINQVQVNIKAGLTFASCLRSLLRQDPDVILVGEIRDLETAEIAFQAAMTGHLVMSTLHTNSSLATISRLLDLGVDPFLITDAASLVIAQRLMRRICPKCKEAYTPSSNLLEKLRLAQPDIVFYHGRGCTACGGSGCSGRLGVYELLRITPTLRELIHRKASEAEMRKAAGLAGTRFLLEDAMEKVRHGLTTLEEVLRVVQLQEDEIIRCPKCGSFINLAFSTCPYCLHALKHLCAGCGQELKLEWKICPYCNTGVTDAAAAAAEQEPAPAPAQRAAAEPAHPPPPPRYEVDKLRILVVDDDEGIRKVVQKALAQLPFPTEVFGACDGQEALESIARQPVDLVILDVMMPRMDGFTVCQRLREDIRTAFLPIIMLTATADESHRTKGYLVGTDDYVTKPFSVPDLHARVARLVRRTYGL
jgi:type II secretory ATPase GspE/PulE/Tfp pilus assembly ATPase PilB-like protein/ActR/RegA family two-component response regulator